MMHTVVIRPSLPKCSTVAHVTPKLIVNSKILPWTSSLSSNRLQLPNYASSNHWFHTTKNILLSPAKSYPKTKPSKSSKSASTKKSTSRTAKNTFIPKEDKEKREKGRRSKFQDKKMGKNHFHKRNYTASATAIPKPKKIQESIKPEVTKPVETTEERKDGEVLYRKVKQDENEMRLDRWIRSHCPLVPQSLLQRMIRKKLVLIEGRDTTADERVLSGQEISFPYALRQTFKPELKEPPVLSQHKLKELHSWILYKDDHIIALNKPPGLATQGGSGINESIDQYLPYFRFEYPEKPRLVHRLDKDTSGILLLGRTRQATIRLQKMIQIHKKKIFMKTYWALVHKVPSTKHGKVEAILQKQKVGNEDKVVLVDSKGGDARASVTYYSVLQNFGNEYSLMALYPETGRMHQLRVVCADVLKTPIVGDPKYGTEVGESTLAEFLKNKENDKEPKLSLLLHARKVECRHPVLDAALKVTAPLPLVFQRLLKSLGLPNYNSLDDSIQKK